MRICIAADSSRVESVMEEKGPEGFFSFFYVDTGPRGSATAAGGRGLRDLARSISTNKADLCVLPAELFLDMEPAERPPLVMASGPLELMAECFRQGCVDYLREPWETLELRARCLRFFRLRIKVGGVEIEATRGRLSLGQTGVELSEEEYRLMRILVLNLNRPVPRTALDYALWGSEKAGSRALDFHISALRQKLRSLSPDCATALVACRGSGYRLGGVSCG
jgi:hypothetical protein